MGERDPEGSTLSQASGHNMGAGQDAVRINHEAAAPRCSIIDALVHRRDPQPRFGFCGAASSDATHSEDSLPSESRVPGRHVSVTSKLASDAAFATSQLAVPLTLIPNVSWTSAGLTAATRSSISRAASTAGPTASRTRPITSPEQTGRKSSPGSISNSTVVVIKRIGHHLSGHVRPRRVVQVHCQISETGSYSAGTQHVRERRISCRAQAARGPVRRRVEHRLPCQWRCRCQSAGTLPRGPGVGWEIGCEVGGGSSSPS